MNRGRYRTQVTIYEPVETRSSTGAVVNSWRIFVRVMAAIVFTSGREYLSHGSPETETRALIETDYVPGITPEMAARADGRAFEIVAVTSPGDLRRITQLQVKEVADHVAFR